MDRRRFLAGIGTGVLVGAAGCGDAATDADGGADRPFPDADWRDEDGLDLETLAADHTETLVDAGGVTLFSTADTSYDGDEEPGSWLPSQEYESGYDLANERQYVRQELIEGDEPEVSELYVADGEALFRQQVGSEVQYDRQSVDRSAEALEETMRDEVVTGIRVEQESAGENPEYEGLNLWNVTSDGGGEVRGEPTARFVADAFEGDRSVPSTVETAAATLHVFESGVVPRLEQSWEGEHEGQGAAVDVDIDYRDIGAALSEPDWVAEARSETSE